MEKKDIDTSIPCKSSTRKKLNLLKIQQDLRSHDEVLNWLIEQVKDKE